MQNPIVHVEPWDVHRELGRLGLNVQIPTVAVEAGNTEYHNCSPLEPRFVPGFEAWRHTQRRLRELLVPKGWEFQEPGNFSISINHQDCVMIVVASGNKATGIVSENPETKSTKGNCMELAVIRNALEAHRNWAQQDSLFGGFDDEKAKKAAKMLKYPVWILLFHIAEDEIRLEISYPDQHQNGKKLESWERRIILPSISTTPSIKQNQKPMDEGPEFKIKIRKKE